jgi:hypothetical protein
MRVVFIATIVNRIESAVHVTAPFDHHQRPDSRYRVARRDRIDKVGPALAAERAALASGDIDGRHEERLIGPRVDRKTPGDPVPGL